MRAKVHFFLTFIWSVASSATLTILLAIPMFHVLIRPLKLPDITFLSKATIAYNFNVLMTYLLNPFVKSLNMPDFTSSPAGLKHFVDVKHLFLLAIFVTIGLGFPAWRLIRKRLYVQFFQGIKLCLSLPVLGLLIGVFGGFDTLFVSFHQLFFRDSTWLFDPATDPVINILPESYFMLCFIMFGVLYLTFWSYLYFQTKRSFSHEKN